MNRRAALLLTGAALAAPRGALAQPGGGMRRVGVLTNLAEADPLGQSQLAAFRQGLDRLGWTEGRNVRIDYRYAAGANVEASRPLAKELIALRPDVVFAPQSNVTGAMRLESATIPVVFSGITDPIGAGLIISLARPGGRFTGMMLLEGSIFGKWLAMLKEIAPRVTRAALMFNAKVNTNILNNFAPAMAAARTLGMELVQSHVETAADIERAIETIAGQPNGGIVQMPDTTTGVHRDLIIGLAARHRLPTVYSARQWVLAGGLVSYGTDSIDMHRQAAYYVDRILRGTPPADLPVQLPTKYETILNLKTAKALGLDVPPVMLVRADEVIE